MSKARSERGASRRKPSGTPAATPSSERTPLPARSVSRNASRAGVTAAPGTGRRVDPIVAMTRTAPDRAEATAAFVTARDWVRYAATRLQHAAVSFGHGTGNALDEASWLVCWALDLAVDRYDEFADARIAASERERIIELVERRCTQRVPLAYLIGEAWLCGYRFRADSRALVPRSPIAEAVVNDSLAPFIGDHEPESVLDLCCGSASIGLIAAHHWPHARVVGSDRSADALALASDNVALHGLQDRVRLVEGDLYGSLRRQRFDLILCNPPYVNADSMAVLPKEFRAEPEAALHGGKDGMALIAKIISATRRHLDADGLLVVEVGHEADAFERRFARMEFTWIPVAAGDRMLAAIRASSLPTAST